MRSKITEEIEIANKYFEKNKTQKVFENLQRLIENQKENDDFRLQAAVHLRKYFNNDPKYIRYQTEEEYYNEASSKNADALLALPEAKHSAQHLKNNFISFQNSTVPIVIQNSSSLIDSLPYIDSNDDLYYKEEANRLIQAEMQNGNPTKDYLELLPYPELKFMTNPLIKFEFDRFQKNEKLNVIKSDYKTKFEAPATNKYRDEKNWNNLLDLLSISQQHLSVKEMNLELITKYGSAAWKKYMLKFENLIKQCEKEKMNLVKSIEEINIQRKFSQTQVSSILDNLKNDYNTQLSQITGLSVECHKIKRKIRKLLRIKNKKLVS